MHYKEYVRGTLNPANSSAIDKWSLITIEDGLGRAGIKSLLSGRGTHIKGIIEFQDSHNSAGIGFVHDFKHRLQSFLQEPEIAAFGYSGEILVISDYLKESPEIYTVFVRNGKVTYKESHILWEVDEKSV